MTKINNEKRSETMFPNQNAQRLRNHVDKNHAREYDPGDGNYSNDSLTLTPIGLRQPYAMTLMTPETVQCAYCK